MTEQGSAAAGRVGGLDDDAVTRQRWCGAVHDGRVVDEAEGRLRSESPDARRRAAAVMSACNEIGRSLARLADEVGGVVRDDVGIGHSPGPAQRRALDLTVADHAAAERTASDLASIGFERWERWSEGAARSFARHAHQLTLVRADASTEVVRVRWPVVGSSMPAPLRAAVTPTEADWSMVALPTWLWRLYPILRVARLITERVGIRRRNSASLGPYLATPIDLVPELGRFAGIGRDDVVVDLGCGDGRLLTELAKATGCRGVGVEHDETLAAAARRRAAAEGLDESVSIVCGDARDLDLTDATVVVLFLPAVVVAQLLPELLRGLGPGARIVAHEQTRLPESIAPSPSCSDLLVAGSSVSVAHLWVAGAG